MSCWSPVVLQPLLIDRTALMGGGSQVALTASGLLVWQLSFVVSTVWGNGKSLDRIPRLSNDSYDKYIVWTELLT